MEHRYCFVYPLWDRLVYRREGPEEGQAMVVLLRQAHPKEGVRRMAKGQTFGGRLKQLREQAGLTQQELADRAGMHRFGVAKLERDERQPSWATVQALAKALGTSCLAFEGTAEPAGDKPPPKRGRPRKGEGKKG